MSKSKGNKSESRAHTSVSLNSDDTAMSTTSPKIPTTEMPEVTKEAEIITRTTITDPTEPTSL